MLSAFRKNSVSIAISAAAFSGFGGWLCVPETASIQSVYERYIASEESRPRVFEEGIAVKLNREAPPVAALEEALRDQPWTEIEVSPGFNVQPTPLRALPVASQRMALSLLSSNESFWRRLDERNEAAVKEAAYEPPIHPAIRRPAEKLRATAPAHRKGVSYIADVGSATDVSRARRAEVFVEPVGDIPAGPTPTRIISKSQTGLSRDQILAALFGPIARPRAVNPQRPAPPSPTFVATDDSSVETTGAPTVTTAGRRAPVGRQITIRGPIELSGGLALTHAKDQIAVLRESRGQFVESGAVWIREARYEIFVESLEGQLVAEVRSPQGEVVGRGHIDLSTMAASDGETAVRRSLDGVAIRIRPVTAGLVGRVSSAYAASTPASVSTSRGVQGAQVSFQQTGSAVKSVSGGHFEDSRFVEGSRVVTNVSVKDHWPTLATITSGSEVTIPVYSRKMMNAFVSLTTKDEAAAARAMESGGVIWGRVVRAGQTVSGAEVEVRTAGGGEPIYFNDLMLPDASLRATGANGIFAMSNVDPGTHVVQVRIGKRLSDPVFLKSGIASVSNIELDVLKASIFETRAYDAFRPDLALAAEIKPMGHLRSRRMVVDRDLGANLKIANLGMPTILEVEGGPEYVSTRMIQNPSSRHLHLPMVSRGWFDRTVGRVRFNNAPATGNIIGYIQGSRFQVSMKPEALSANAKVIYFDSRGETLDQDFGEPGGGFIILGAQNGLQTVVIASEGSDRVFAATVLVEDGHVASVSHWLR